MAGALQASVLLRHQANRNPIGTVPYIVDVNVVPLFSEYSSALIVRAGTAGREQMGACMLFAAMPRVGEPGYDEDREMLDIIHDEGEGGGGGYEDGHVTPRM